MSSRSEVLLWAQRIVAAKKSVQPHQLLDAPRATESSPAWIGRKAQVRVEALPQGSAALRHRDANAT